MPPPPVTPSPHRFIVKKEALSIQPAALAQPHTPRPRTQQFNDTPRFTYSSTPQQCSKQTAQDSTSGTARFSTPGQRAPKPQDVIEDFSDDLSCSIPEPIENYDNDIVDEKLHYMSVDKTFFKLDEPTPKRRRRTLPVQLEDEKALEQPLDDYTSNDEQEVPLSSYMPTILSPPPPPWRPKSSGRRKFVISTPAPETLQATNSTQSAFPNPPRFLPLDPSESDTPDPLPEQFSPHRKGHKYLPSGLASEVRDWLTNISSPIPAAKTMDNPWIVRIWVDEVSGGRETGMTLVKGRQIRDEEVAHQLGCVKVILAGEGLGAGMRKGTKVEAGKVVGVKGPMWEVFLEGERCGVGVEWKVLN